MTLLRAGVVRRHRWVRKLFPVFLLAGLWLLHTLAQGSQRKQSVPSNAEPDPDFVAYLNNAKGRLAHLLSGLVRKVGRYERCAIVGESTSLYTGPRLYAEEIDGHDAVFRLPVVEGMSWYRRRHMAFKGAKTTLQVHYTGNKSFEGVPGEHSICGAVEIVPLVMMRTAAELGQLATYTKDCPDIAVELLYIESFVQEDVHALHDRLAATAPWPGSKLQFTEEWLATYLALTMCDTVNLYGVITETEAYVYGEDQHQVDVSSTNPKHWAHALRMLGVRDIAHDALLLSIASNEAHKPLPDDYVTFIQRRFGDMKASAQNRARFLKEPNGFWDKSCAVVGAAPTLKGSGLGRWIDMHESVWRCNQHVADPHDPIKVNDLGARTDILVFMEKNLLDRDDNMRIMLEASRRLGTRAILYPPPMKEQAATPTKVNYDLQLDREYAYVNPLFFEAVFDWLIKIAPVTEYNGGWFYHSTGTFAVHLALFMCKTVSVAGFGLGRLTLYHHGFLMEATLLELYAQAGLIKLEVPDEIRHELRAYLNNMMQSGVLHHFNTHRVKTDDNIRH